MRTESCMEALEDRPGVYVLRGAAGDYLYKGSSKALRCRVREHMSGSVPRTRSRRPLELVYFEYCRTYSEAQKREAYLKSGAGREWLQRRLLTRDFPPTARCAPAADPP